MEKSFFVCYSGTDRYGNTHVPYKAVVQTADEAIAVINTWKTYGKKDSSNRLEQIVVNALTETKIREYFANGQIITYDGYKTDYLKVRTTGCGCWDIIIRHALADTLEEHERIYNEQREIAKQERMHQAEIAKQKRLDELNELKRGWYHVELELCLSVFNSHGNDYRTNMTFSGSVIADSGMDAYRKAVEDIKKEGFTHRGNIAILETWAEPTSNGFQCTFLGVKTDEGYSVKLWEEWHKNGDI